LVKPICKAKEPGGLESEQKTIERQRGATNGACMLAVAGRKPLPQKPPKPANRDVKAFPAGLAYRRFNRPAIKQLVWRKLSLLTP